MRRLWTVLMLVAMFAASSPARAEDLVIFAAASLKNALDAAAQSYQQKNGDKVRVSYAASSALARQIENGAPADLFISADLDWMDYVAKKGLTKPGTRSDLIGNKLVLIAPADSTVKAEIAPNFPLASLLAGGRLAMADPDAVPAGKYGKAALQTLGVWASVEGMIAGAEDVRAALRFVSRGEAPLGIVYQTDAAAEPGVKIVGVFPATSYPPVVYPVAALAGGKPDSVKFIAFLQSSEARGFFVSQGFTILE